MPRLKRIIQMKCSECHVCKDSMLRFLSKDELERIGDAKTTNTYEKGQIIFHEGAKPLGLFAVHGGKVKISKIGSDGGVHIVRLARSGDFLGYRALLGDEHYSATAAALEDAIVCFIEASVFKDVMNQNRDLASKMIRQLCRELRVAEEHIADLVQKPVRERLAETLSMLAVRYSEAAPSDDTVDLFWSREDLANMVGTATETLIRHLSEFREEGILETSGRKIRVLNRQALLDIAGIED